jgi:hypothetical protein
MKLRILAAVAAFAVVFAFSTSLVAASPAAGTPYGCQINSSACATTHATTALPSQLPTTGGGAVHAQSGPSAALGELAFGVLLLGVALAVVRRPRRPAYRRL